jgi:penicillin V acylase-like amidase (Ntn superfamily)
MYSRATLPIITSVCQQNLTGGVQREVGTPTYALLIPLPGNVNPADRFQRAAYYLALLPEPKTEREAVANAVQVAVLVDPPSLRFRLHAVSTRQVGATMG